MSFRLLLLSLSDLQSLSVEDMQGLSVDIITVQRLQQFTTLIVGYTLV